MSPHGFPATESPFSDVSTSPQSTEPRVDALTGTLVLVAPHRRGIAPPSPAAPGLPDVPRARCPFCPGHEAEAEPTVAQWPAEGAWRARIVGNRYALAGDAVTGLRGAHEVVIETPDHDLDLADYDPAHAAAVLNLVAARIATLAARPGIAAVLTFRNRGRRAGSSQPHAHAQLLALDRVPGGTADRDARARHRFAESGRTLLAELLDDELRDGRRIVRNADGIVTLCPHASQHPYELRLAPRGGGATLAALAPETRAALAAALVDAAKRLRAAGIGDDYNVLFHEPPVASRSAPWSAFHIDVTPRSTCPAGLELVSGCTVLTVTPEAAALTLRNTPR
jgi:UDPglucose--hexose-1-phosphate uridylyltransferase